jgi:nucleoside triphosphate diphosphatase
MSEIPDLLRLLKIMAQLRDREHGCPWDRAQSFATIAPYTIEEAYEVAEACERNDPVALKDELGDLLFQVVFHARMAQEAGLFDFNDVAQAVAEKMVRRHPHVFADAVVADVAAQTGAWEEHKAEERRVKDARSGAPPSALDGVTEALPALTRALKLQHRAARVGFDWPALPPILDKIAEESRELRAELDRGGSPQRIEEEIGDLLFAVVNLARRVETDPEQALRRACRKFETRFRRVESLLAEAGMSAAEAGLDAMERHWQRAKMEEEH